MDDLGWTVVGVVLFVIACAIAGWGAFELRDPPPRPPVIPVVAPAPVPARSDPSAADVDRFYATAHPVACPLDGEAAASPGGAYRLDPAGVDPALLQVADSLSHDASIEGRELILLAPPGASRATVQLDDYGELVATWTDPGPVGPKAQPTPCSATLTARATPVSGRVLDPRGSDVVADCAIRRAHVEEDPATYVIDVPIGRACHLQLIAADGRDIGPPHAVTAAGPTTVDLP
jgi:hypothetical protein